MEMAKKINADFQDKNPFFVSVLNGSFMFTADLLKNIYPDCGLGFIGLRSYQGMESSGEIKQTFDLADNLKDRHVIVLEDIVDTGQTIHYILNEIGNLNPASVSVAALLQKMDTLKVDVKIAYSCFTIPDKFVVGYGLDYDGWGRNYPDIYIASNE